MLIYPNINPVALDLGFFQIHWYGVMYLLAFGCAWALATYRAKQRGWNGDMVSDLIFFGALGVILGGRIGYVFFYGFEQFLQNPLWLFQVWTGGMSFHGGFLGVAIAMIFWCKKYQKSWFETLDFVVPCVPTGLMFGRIGNFIGGELWGRPVQNMDYPLAMIFPHVDNIARHPSQLYQALCEGLLLFIVLWWFSSKPRPRMAVSAVFLIGYGVARFTVEFFREPDNGQLFIASLSKGQVLTIPMIIIGVILLMMAYQKKIYDIELKQS